MRLETRPPSDHTLLDPVKTSSINCDFGVPKNLVPKENFLHFFLLFFLKVVGCQTDGKEGVEG